MKLLIITLLFINFTTHEYYSSITNINYEASQKVFLIDIQLDTEDLEYALNNHFDTICNLGEVNELKMADALLLAYLKEHLIIEAKNQILEFEIESKQIDWAHTFIYLKSDFNKKKINNLKVRNSLLTDYYEEQSNIVQVVINGKTFSDLLTNSKTSFEKNW